MNKSEILTVVGPNGAGKTTLLRLILGAIKPSNGKISVKKGTKIGYVPQKINIDPTLPLTVSRFLNLPMKTESKQVRICLEQAGVDNLSSKQLSEISGGEVQKVLLARALLNKPDLLILDEATRGMDHLASMEFYRRLEYLKKDLNCGIILVSHELHVVMAASDRVMCLNGHICCQGKPGDVVSNPEYKALFGLGSDSPMAFYKHEHDHHHHHSEPS